MRSSTLPRLRLGHFTIMFSVRRSIGFIKRIRDNWRDMDLNRKCVGKDAYDNKYYQYYDDQNLPLKREVEYAKGIHHAKFDPVWFNWLQGKDKDPPTGEEVDNSYRGYLDRQEIGKQWDARDEEMMKTYRETLKKAAPPRHKKDFTPESWAPSHKGNKKY